MPPKREMAEKSVAPKDKMAGKIVAPKDNMAAHRSRSRDNYVMSSMAMKKSVSFVNKTTRRKLVTRHVTGIKTAAIFSTQSTDVIQWRYIMKTFNEDTNGGH